MRWKSFVLLIAIVAFTVLGAFFVSPRGPLADSFAKKYLPWRLGLDLVGGSYLSYEIDVSQVPAGDYDSVINGLRDVIEKRVNLFGVSEPRVTNSKVGSSYRLNVELAGIRDIKSAINQIGETPLLYFAEVDMTDANNPKFRATDITGRYIQRAQLNFSQVNLPIVALEFNDEGASLFEKLTEQNIGKYLAVFLDGQPIEVARVDEKIAGGHAQITGIQDVKAAQQLVERLNAGALPAPIKLINQQTISASLGQDSLNKTIWAGLIGTVAILLFMIGYYRVLGLFASLALGIYIILALAIFKLFGVTMTLAGIAGFILSIGMAVDANILIFERTREEMKKGLAKATALQEGFKRAWTSIRDSNLTTMLTALILYNATTSFVKGFALTLLIGVLLSMFTAISVTRSLLRAFYLKE